MSIALRSPAVRLLPILAAAWLAAACDVTIGLESGRFVEREKKDFQVTGTPDLTLSTFDGSVEIRAWDRPEVSVEVEKRGGNKQQVDEIEVKASQSGNRITIDVVSPGHGRTHFGFSSSRSARLIVSVPRQANLDARTGDGSITIERINGRVQLTTGDGSVKVTEVAGELRAHTGDGSIVLDRVDGRVDADTGDGSIALNGKLEGVRLRTGDGSVRLRADTGSRMGDDWDVHTGDGSVTLELPEPFDADIDAHTGDGTIAIQALGVKGDVSKNTVRGQIGSGGHSLRVTSGDGTIRISRS
jgi:DUF4097 and DUF4098 domain-containing protein YvlB